MSGRSHDISRRQFLNRVAALASLAAAYPAVALERLRLSADSAERLAWQTTEPWKTLADVQEHLFPSSDDVPGARDVHAIVYLRNAIGNADADAEDREFIVNGVGWLNELTLERYGANFSDLDERQREVALRQIEQSRAGRNWLSLLLTYLLESLLADPVYGGNPRGVGWRWLEHQPGYPTPPLQKAWYRLGKPVYRRSKA